MQIRRLTAFHLPIRLRKSVRHASHERSLNDTIIVKCTLSDGSAGWGEGLPRTYVTGESIDSAWRHLAESDYSILCAPFSSSLEIADRIDGWNLADVAPDPAVVPRECFGNSVRCAIELAILDAACRAEQISISDLIRKHSVSRSFAVDCDQVCYSGTITAEAPRSQWLSAWKMKLFRFRMVKVKVGSSDISDEDSLRRIRRIVGQKVDLRIDANEAWECEDIVERMRPLMPFRPSCIEQPVPHRTVQGLREVRSILGLPVMLDESLCCYEDAVRAIEGQYCDLFNIRLSKCGGLVRSLKLVALARQHGLGYQLGCQVGETGILSAAGRHFACSIPDLRYLEGSFDRFLVHDRLTEEDLTFRYGGRGDKLYGTGLCVDINECQVRSLAIRQQDLVQ